jgi:hypothetical protein
MEGLYQDKFQTVELLKPFVERYEFESTGYGESG